MPCFVVVARPVPGRYRRHAAILTGDPDLGRHLATAFPLALAGPALDHLIGTEVLDDQHDDDESTQPDRDSFGDHRRAISQGNALPNQHRNEERQAATLFQGLQDERHRTCSGCPSCPERSHDRRNGDQDVPCVIDEEVSHSGRYPRRSQLLLAHLPGRRG